MNQSVFLHKGLACLAAALAVFVALGADTFFHWTGEAGDGKWSTPGNWEEQAAPSSFTDSEHRIVVLPGGSVSSNDYANGFSLKQVQFTGAGRSVLTGSRITINASCPGITVTDSDVVISNEVVNAWGTGVSCTRGELIFAGPVKSTRGADFSVSDAGNGSSSYQSHVRFLGGLKFEGSQRNYSLKYELGVADDFGKGDLQHLESALDVANCIFGRGSGWTFRLQIDAPGSAWTTARIKNGTVYAGAQNVFASTGVIEPNNTSSQAWWDLNGFDQTIDRIGGTYQNTGFRSATSATLTMNATADGNFDGPFDGSVSLVWNPSDAWTFYAGGESQTDGDITVCSGAFCVSDAGSFKNVKNLLVADGAEFILTTTTEQALAAVESVQLDGTMKFDSEDSLPLPKAKVTLGANGKFKIGTGRTLRIPAVKVGGEYVPDTDYAGVDWIDGEGTVRVDSSLITQGELVWKNAADGLWNVPGNWFGNAAPDGTKPQTIAVGGADFTVTVPDGTDIGNVLRVGGHSQSGVATLAPAGATALEAGSRTTVGNHGRIAVPENATLSIAADTSAATSDKVVDIVNGGVFEVCGGQLSVGNLYGLFCVGDRGVFKISSGRADIQAHSPSPSSSGAINGLRVLEGGTVEVSGDGVLAPHSGQWGAFPLVNIGGTVKVKDEGMLLFDSKHAAEGKEYSEYVGGSGRIELSGNGRIAFDDGTAGSITFPCVHGDGKCEISVTDNAAFCLTNATVVVGKSFWYAPANGSMHLTLDSTADNHIGNVFILGADGRNGLTAEMEIKRGRVIVGGDGMKLARRNEPSAGNPITSPIASVSMTGGVLSVSGVNADQGEAYYTAFELGNSLPEDTGSTTDASAVYTATFTQSGGIVSNLHGRIALATGKALGRYVQSGGAFVSGSRAAAFFGAYDGEGRWEMTGGTATFNETIYLGIGSTLATLLGNYAKCNLGSHVVGTAAKGVLDIEAGVFETAGDIISGTDGNTGSITVGPAGVLKAKNLRMLNAAADSLTVKVGPNGAGRIELSDTLDLAEGIKLKIDGAGTYVGEPAKFDLLKCKDSTRPLTELTIEGEIPAKMRLSRTPSRIRLVTDPTGMMLILR